MTQKTFLDSVYEVSGADETIAIYDKWSASYDKEVAENGYATPGRVARALAQVTSKSASILDYGCGTGLSGLALKTAGFTQVHGADPSPEMLDGAAQKQVYDSLTLLDLDKGPPFAQGQFDVIAAIGVLGAGAAPAPVFDLLFDLLAPGNLFAFSFNDHTLEQDGFASRVTNAITSQTANIVFQGYGDHLPGMDMNSMVYVLQRR